MCNHCGDLLQKHQLKSPGNAGQSWALSQGGIMHLRQTSSVRRTNNKCKSVKKKESGYGGSEKRSVPESILLVAD